MNKSQITNHRQHVNTRGMSFVEAMIWIGVTALLFASIAAGIIQVYNSNSYTMQRIVGVISARKGLEESVRLIRKAAYSDAGEYPLVEFTDNSITFYVDKDNDGSVELVRIFLDGQNLNIGVVEPEGVPATYDGYETVNSLVWNIRNESLNKNLFTYYNTDGNEVLDQGAILEPRYVEVVLVANTGKDPTVEDYELKSSAYMRNLQN